MWSKRYAVLIRLGNVVDHCQKCVRNFKAMNITGLLIESSKSILSQHRFFIAFVMTLANYRSTHFKDEHVQPVYLLKHFMTPSNWFFSIPNFLETTTSKFNFKTLKKPLVTLKNQFKFIWIEIRAYKIHFWLSFSCDHFFLGLDLNEAWFSSTDDQLLPLIIKSFDFEVLQKSKIF